MDEVKVEAEPVKTPIDQAREKVAATLALQKSAAKTEAEAEDDAKAAGQRLAATRRIRIATVLAVTKAEREVALLLRGRKRIVTL